MTQQNTNIMKACLLIFILLAYLNTLYPIYKLNDSPETITSVHTLGISHPPSYPLHTMTAKVFTIMPLGNIGFRVNLFSAFLAVISILMVIRLLQMIVYRVLRKKTVFLFVFIPVFFFSVFFWDQAIEAKGGIFTLNFLFMAVLLYLSVKMLFNYRQKELYLFSFVLGLALCNHWPSVFPMLPAFIYFLNKQKQKITGRDFLISAGFIVLGLTPYLYLPIRAVANPPINWGDPESLQSFLWVVSRTVYSGSMTDTAGYYIYQPLRFFKTLAGSFNILLLLLMPGIYYMYKVNRSLFKGLMLLGIFNFIAVSFIYRINKDIIWLLDIYYIPAFFTLFVFMAFGGVVFYESIKNKKVKTALYFVLGAVIAVQFYISYEKNNNRRNFIYYDHAMNILQTIDQNAVYIGYEDNFTMPLYYPLIVEHKREDMKFITGNFFAYDWGVDLFNNKYGADVRINRNSKKTVMEQIIEEFHGSYNIFLGYRFDILNLDIPYEQEMNGLLREIGMNDSVKGDLFQAYRYRGMLDVDKSEPAEYYLFQRYILSMIYQADYYMEKGIYDKALNLYRQALLIPSEFSSFVLLYKISKCFRYMGDYRNEEKILQEIIIINSGFLYAYERLGELYYDNGIYPIAVKYLQEAVKRGSENYRVKRLYDHLRGISLNELFEMSFKKGGVYLEQGDLASASKIYKVLIDNKYKEFEIFEMLGDYHTEIRNYSEAVKCYDRCIKIKPDKKILIKKEKILSELNRHNKNTPGS